MKVRGRLWTTAGVLGLGVAAYALTGPSLCLRGPTRRALPTAPLAVGDTIRLRAGGLDILAECDLGPPSLVHWMSTDNSVLRVGSTGLVTAVGPGTAQVVVRSAFTWASHSILVVR